MAGGRSKTANKSIKAGAARNAGINVWLAGETKRVIPLNQGRHAYVIHPVQGTLHVATDSPEFAQAISEFSAHGAGERLRSELTALAHTYPTHAWPRVLGELNTAGVFNPANE